MASKKQLFAEINLGIGDHVFFRTFLDGIKDQYDRIFITHSRDALAYWFANDPNRKDFNNKLAAAVFNELPYVFVPNPTFRYPFFFNERIIKELNNKPVKPDLTSLCVGKSIDIKNYIVITTKVRELEKSFFDEIKDKLTLSLKDLASKFTIVILGEREVQRTKEYEAECNKSRVFGIYNYLLEVLPKEKIIDLTVPALGNTTSSFSQFQQDCLIMKEANAIITFGTGGNTWMSFSLAKQSICLRGDNELDRLSITEFPDVSLTKDIDQFSQYLTNLH